VRLIDLFDAGKNSCAELIESIAGYMSRYPVGEAV
jgi:hypothetical protein